MARAGTIRVELDVEQARELVHAAAADLVAERDALQEAVRELHGFIVREFDRDPAPVAAYITDPAARHAATRACPEAG